MSRGLSKELPHMPEGCRQTAWLLQGPKWGTRLAEQLRPVLTTPAYEDGRRAPGTLALSTDTLAPDLLWDPQFLQTSSSFAAWGQDSRGRPGWHCHTEQGGQEFCFPLSFQYIPMPVLYGVFLYMGVASLNGIQVRLFLPQAGEMESALQVCFRVTKTPRAPFPSSMEE